ncbi:MAG: hypothetical protein OEX14_03425 [Paracoccaceae bacterium]|nr:hypothetical protein [Paracoccaceae bacterium]
MAVMRETAIEHVSERGLDFVVEFTQRSRLPLKITLIIFFLSIESSYIQNKEVEVEGFADTTQWVVRGDDMWRIKTFAIDKDVHVFKINHDGKSPEDLIKIARLNTLKHYGEVVSDELILNTEDGVAGLRIEMAAIGLDAHLNESGDGFVFWSPDGTKYSSKSKPE